MSAPDKAAIAHAAGLIRAGKLVAFPTETVYGLGANALDAAAVARIFTSKRRPATSPLIVHVDSIAMARSLARVWPDAAECLAGRYWPGPLTLIVPKVPAIPDAVTAGLPTVGLRLPAHPVAIALIRAAGVPIAAPSANRFTQLSPTTADHVRKSLADEVDYVLDGGPTEVGIESTVLSLATPRPLLLRPGVIPLPDLEALIGPIDVLSTAPQTGAHLAPGMHLQHYQPRTPLYLLGSNDTPPSGRGVWLRLGGRTALEYAAALYESLHRFDEEDWDWIAVERPPDDPEWAGVADRLRRAASPLL